MVHKQAAAGAVVYNPEGKEFLLLKHRQGHWAFPQGKPEGSEELSRELKEETGLDIVQAYGPVCDVSYKFSRNMRKIVKTVHFWAVIAEGELTLSSEHHGYLWASYKQAKKLLKFKNHTDALKAAYTSLKKNQAL